VVIFAEGYQTLAREVRIRPGEVIALKDAMQPGESKSPEELFAQVERPAKREVARERTVRDRSEPPARDSDQWRERAPAPAAPPPTRDQDWRERDDRAPIGADRRAEPARLKLRVAPADAVVYLDGRLLGSGEQLLRLHSDLLVDPGSHRVEVTRPGYRTHTIEIEVEAGEQRELSAELEPQR
jgi:hypothetical protein